MITNSKLKQTTAVVNDVLAPKTFYSGDKILKQGTIPSMSGDTVTLGVDPTSITFNTLGKYCTGDMNVVTNTMEAESWTPIPSGSAQSHTFATSGKLCTGNMTVSVASATNWPMRMIRMDLYSTYEQTTTLDVEDGDGTYELYIGWCVKNSNDGIYGGLGEIKFQGTTLVSVTGQCSGFSGPFTFNITSSNKTLTYRWYWFGLQNFIYRRIS